MIHSGSRGLGHQVATDALVQGKKVTLEYNPDGVQIIVEERDGSKQVSRLQWG